jgi:D-alanyl-D-alanine carboxypeptidase
LDNAGLPGQPIDASGSPPIDEDDIPAALRDDDDTPIVNRLREDKPIARSRYSLKPFLLIGGALLGAIAFVAGILIGIEPQLSSLNSSKSAQNTTEPSQNVTNSPASDQTLLGHFPYQAVPTSELQSITGYGNFKLRKAAAKQYQAMVAAARADGVIIVPISGFRTIAEQQHLFFDVKAQRGQLATERAEVSAPPGYSEHHTGYAVDIGDGNVPATNLNPKFEDTKAFKWMKQNAARFNFELSFPRDNPQGVSYEPWHWRFIGDRNSLETFYKAKTASGNQQEPATNSQVSTPPTQNPESNTNN